MSTEENPNQNDSNVPPDYGGEEQEQERAAAAAAAPLPKTVTPPVIPTDWAQMACADKAPVIRYPTDVAGPEVWDANETDTIILVGTSGQKITNLGPDFGTTLNPQLAKLILRSHLLSKMEGLQSFQNLELLELYDNQIEALEGLEPFGATLRVLDMSYNVIRDMTPVQTCPHLEELCKSSLTPTVGRKSNVVYAARGLFSLCSLSSNSYDSFILLCFFFFFNSDGRRRRRRRRQTWQITN